MKNNVNILKTKRTKQLQRLRNVAVPPLNVWSSTLACDLCRTANSYTTRVNREDVTAEKEQTWADERGCRQTLTTHAAQPQQPIIRPTLNCFEKAARQLQGPRKSIPSSVGSTRKIDAQIKSHHRQKEKVANMRSRL